MPKKSENTVKSLKFPAYTYESEIFAQSQQILRGHTFMCPCHLETLVGGGSVINATTPSSFLVNIKI